MKKIILKFIYHCLRRSAERLIRRFNPVVIAVTGSVGKSSTKEALWQVLYDHFGDEVRKNYGNLNTEIGVPLTILGYDAMPIGVAWPILLIQAWYRSFALKNYPKYLILEFGIDKPGDMKYLAGIARPDIAIITSTAGAHLAYFKDWEEYRREKISLLDFLKEDGRAFINIDDQGLSQITREKITPISIDNRQAGYRAEDINATLGGTEYRIICTGRKISIKTAVLGRQAVYAQLFAFAVADQLQIPSLKIAKSLEQIRPTNGRMSVIEGKNQTVLIDDTYNAASPASVKAAIDFLAGLTEPGRKVLILGNMNELGNVSEKIHLEVAGYANGKCDLAIFAGPMAAKMAKIFEAGRALAFKNRLELEVALNSLIQRGDIILIKASQNNNYFEEVTKALMKEPARASELLVRQEASWIKKKRRNGSLKPAKRG